jgi:hypothetical protein
MPWLGLGVWRSRPGRETENAVRWALEVGYRHIDTAALYENEPDVGKAVRRSAIPRESIFITTKVWNSDQGYANTPRAFDVSRRKLGVDVVDLYLVHWPMKGRFLDTWKALEKLYAGKGRFNWGEQFPDPSSRATPCHLQRDPGCEPGGVPSLARAEGVSLITTLPKESVTRHGPRLLVDVFSTTRFFSRLPKSTEELLCRWFFDRISGSELSLFQSPHIGSESRRIAASSTSNFRRAISRSCHHLT